LGLRPTNLRRLFYLSSPREPSSNVNVRPQWCGQLEWTAFKPALGPAHRARRVQLSCGEPEDPSVEVVVTQSRLKIAEILPDA
jgi:hypothetical protein